MRNVCLFFRHTKRMHRCIDDALHGRTFSELQWSAFNAAWI